MSSVASYIMLYLKEYINYIFDDKLQKVYTISKDEKDDIKRNLLNELSKTIYMFVNTFNVKLNFKSTAAMSDLKNYKKIKNINSSNENYKIFLDHSYISLEYENGVVFLLITICDNNNETIAIRQLFDLEKYCKTKDFGVVTEAGTMDYLNWYLKLFKDKILIYNADTWENKKTLEFNENINIFPDDIKVVDENSELEFFRYLNNIYNNLVVNGYNNQQKG